MEDDPAFQTVLCDYLAEAGYCVCPVKNGGEGVAQVLSGEFSLVLCDLNMPGLPGDMFYRAVERIRPDLCSRFVFMTGYRGDEKLNEYIRSIGCWLLRKPFPLEDLLALFAFTAERPMMETVCDLDQVTGNPVGSPVHAQPLAPTPAPAPLNRPAPNYPPVPISGVRPHVPLATTANPVSWLSEVAVPASPSRNPSRGSSRWIDVCAIIAVVFGFHYLAKNSRAAAGLEDLRTLQTRWTQIEPEYARISAQRAEFAEAVAAAERIKRADLRWISTIGRVALAINPSIEILDLRGREIPDQFGASETRIRGIALGEHARRAADRFRQVIEDSFLSDVNPPAVSVTFERLEETRSESDASARTEFTILVAVNPRQTFAGLHNERR